MSLKPWFPDHPAIYDIEKDYAENHQKGPFFQDRFPKRPKAEKMIDFLGFPIRSRLGVPAGPLLNARWVALAAKLGFDVPTYKTIRSFAHLGHPLPNILFVEPIGEQKAIALKKTPEDLLHLSITNSFGMPSQGSDYLLEDIEKANRALDEGQVMIVSVVGSIHPSCSFETDFVRAAELAKAAGANIIEANFSCPNVAKETGCLYMHPEIVQRLTEKIAKAIHPTPLILKMGLFSSLDQMQASLLAAARGGARAICGINTISMEVINGQGEPALGKDRWTSGVCGSAIRKEALRFVREVKGFLDTEKLDLLLLGCGGIVLPEHFDLFLEEGAHLALSATGMMWDPLLALRYHRNQDAKQSAHSISL